jgi:hypothetical protein
MGAPVPLALANDQHDWLAANWEQLKDDENGAAIEKARLLAESGELVVASWKNPTGSHGHIAVCVPAADADEGKLCVSAAGGQNWMQAPIEKSFGLSIHPDFFTPRAAP